MQETELPCFDENAGFSVYLLIFLMSRNCVGRYNITYPIGDDSGPVGKLIDIFHIGNAGKNQKSVKATFDS